MSVLSENLSIVSLEKKIAAKKRQLDQFALENSTIDLFLADRPDIKNPLNEFEPRPLWKKLYLQRSASRVSAPLLQAP